MKPPCGHRTLRAALIFVAAFLLQRCCGNHAASDAQRQAATDRAEGVFFR
jgi:hypothetical protein